MIEQTDQAVHVVKRLHRWGAHTEVYYTIQCTRCHSGVEGGGRLRNCQWATKSVAMKHAQAHADWHSHPGHYFPDGEIVAVIPAVIPA